MFTGSEKQTRTKRIDQQLRSASWIIIPFELGLDFHQMTHHVVEEFQTAHGPADYALFLSKATCWEL